MNSVIKGVLLILIPVVAACSQNNGKTTESAFVLAGDENVLAIVNKSPVTEYELETTIKETIGEKNASKLGETGRKKVLESIVASRAISQAYLNEVSAQDLAKIEKKVDAYREKLLVQAYIAKNVTPEPVSQAMVKAYYEQNPERFGAEIKKEFEMISTSRNLHLKERDAFLMACKHPENQKDWKTLAGDISRKQLPAIYSKNKAVKGLLQEDLFKVVSKLKKGETSKIFFIDERPFVLRVTGVTKEKPKPLNEVSHQIRKSLAPKQLKKAIKSLSADIMKKAEITYR